MKTTHIQHYYRSHYFVVLHHLLDRRWYRRHGHHEYRRCQQQHHHVHCEDNRRRAGYDIILASDLVYMTKSLEPLWQTIDRLLIKNDSDGDNLDSNGGDAEDEHKEHDYDGKVGYVLFSWYCSSQCSMEELLAMATKYGFTWTRPVIAATPPPTGNEEESNENNNANTSLSSVQDGIYIFKRKKKKKKKT